MALDLGCGSGFQTFALASLGAKRVLAVDTSEQLLKELAGRTLRDGIELFHRDLTEFRSFISGSVDTVVCMGDTLTHLDRREDVTKLFENVADVLDASGRFVISYRDLSTELHGVDRFIPLRSTAEKIMTCFLEWDGDRVVVHDLIHIRQDKGWVLRKSAYPKLILPFSQLCEELSTFGFRLDFHACEQGIHSLGLVAR
jgi:SAM-dependent methyltransferase